MDIIYTSLSLAQELEFSMANLWRNCRHEQLLQSCIQSIFWLTLIKRIFFNGTDSWILEIIKGNQLSSAAAAGEKSNHWANSLAVSDEQSHFVRGLGAPRRHRQHISALQDYSLAVSPNLKTTLSWIQDRPYIQCTHIHGQSWTLWNKVFTIFLLSFSNEIMLSPSHLISLLMVSVPITRGVHKDNGIFISDITQAYYILVTSEYEHPKRDAGTWTRFYYIFHF